jgi:hypothetical protein
MRSESHRAIVDQRGILGKGKKRRFILFPPCMPLLLKNSF